MNWLNFHHLLYFRSVAREGGVVRAAKYLHVSAPTISAQVRQLEEHLGERLFLRTGRHLVLTELGHTVLRYADEVFDLGRELEAHVRRRDHRHPERFQVGLSNTVPKLIAHRLLEPALEIEPPFELTCIEGSPNELVGKLSTYSLDLVLTDAPCSSELAVRAFDHLLGECGVSFYATRKVAARLAKKFPQSLDGQPMLLPTRYAALRTALEHWFQELDIRPHVVGSFDDPALMKVFGATGTGVFPSPTAIEADVVAQHHVHLVGRAETIRERFYAISVERRLQHPAVVAISRRARDQIFRSRSRVRRKSN